MGTEEDSEKKSPLKDLFAGTTLDGYLEAARVRPLTEFMPQPSDWKNWIMPILRYINDESVKEGWVSEEKVYSEFAGKTSKEDIKKVINQLIREGSIYEPRPGFLRKT
jgi:hypothetical protein